MFEEHPKVRRANPLRRASKHYESLFGDPKAVLLTTVQPLVNDLRKTELGETFTALEGAVGAGEAVHPPQ